MLCDSAQVLYLLVFVVLCAVPFFFYGTIIASCLKEYARASGKIYAFDLFGAACGVALALSCLTGL
jgi:hypothetical protein